MNICLGTLLFAGGERGSGLLQGSPKFLCGRLRAAEDAPRGPFHLLKRRHGLADIVERGGVVLTASATRRPSTRRSRAPPERSAGVPDPVFWKVMEFWQLGEDWRRPCNLPKI